jgi:hypothetical protein
VFFLFANCAVTVRVAMNSFVHHGALASDTVPGNLGHVWNDLAPP